MSERILRAAIVPGQPQQPAKQDHPLAHLCLLPWAHRAAGALYPHRDRPATGHLLDLCQRHLGEFPPGNLEDP